MAAPPKRDYRARLTELLERWAELEPNRCISPERTSSPERGEYLVVIGGGMYGVFNTLVQEHYPESPGDAMHVQAAVQEACKAHGWGWSLHYYPDDGVYNALVVAGPYHHWSGRLGSPLIGLLSMHVAALEAEATT